MRQTTSIHKRAPRNSQLTDHAASAGVNGIALIPPTYWADATDHTLQMRADPGRNKASAQPENKTGLPDDLKAGLEQLSGLALDDVRVHYNSIQPARLQALAHTQGTEIHVGPGQERQLPHEAWHVVQQKQGRVRPTAQTQGLALNDDARLEREADLLGAKASRMQSPGEAGAFTPTRSRMPGDIPVIQRYEGKNKKEKERIQALRREYIKLNNDDDEYYGPKFNEAVEAAATMEEVEQIVEKVKTAKAAASAKLAEFHKAKASEPTTTPKPTPKLSVPTVQTPASTTVTPKPKPKRTKGVSDPSLAASLFGGSPYTPKPEPVVDPFAGLSSKVRPLAEAISQWNQTTMAGTSAKLSLTEQSELETWVTAQTTKGGKQKYVVNIGPGTGTYSGTWQFKVTGFASLGAKSATYHITLT